MNGYVSANHNLCELNNRISARVERLNLSLNYSGRLGLFAFSTYLMWGRPHNELPLWILFVDTAHRALFIFSIRVLGIQWVTDISRTKSKTSYESKNITYFFIRNIHIGHTDTSYNLYKQIKWFDCFNLTHRIKLISKLVGLISVNDIDQILK